MNYLNDLEVHKRQQDQQLLETEETCASLGIHEYSKTFVIQPLSKRPQICFQDQLSLNAGQKYCRMPQGEHSAILSTFIKLPFVIKIFVLSIFEWPFYTGFTVLTVPFKFAEDDLYKICLCFNKSDRT